MNDPRTAELFGAYYARFANTVEAAVARNIEGGTPAEVAAAIVTTTTLVAAVRHPEWANAWVKEILRDVPEFDIAGAADDWVRLLNITPRLQERQP